MGAKVPSVKGMNDLLPKESARWRLLEDAAREVFARYGYEEARTPIVEETALFARGIGEGTDVVGKEMYTFADRDGTSLSLRPEGTAGLARAYVEHGFGVDDPQQRWFYLGAMFRHERPQKGRYRQFHQLGVEALGSADPRVDAEQLELAQRFFERVGLKDVSLRVNSVGDEACRPAYRERLVACFVERRDALCDAHRAPGVLEKNPLRVLDCKSEACRAASAGAPMLLEHLCGPCAEHFARVRSQCDLLSVNYEVDPRIVRGLDYYTRTAFEWVAATGLGSQNAIGGGGRYDQLVRELGGPATPGVGFALGEERLALVLEAQGLGARRGPDLFLATMGPEGDDAVLRVASQCRAAGARVECNLRKANLGNQMKRADRTGAAYVVVLGPNELASGRVKLKALATGVEEEAALEGLGALVVSRVTAENGTRRL